MIESRSPATPGRPFAGAWIETSADRHSAGRRDVAPSQGRGSKQRLDLQTKQSALVAPSQGRPDWQAALASVTGIYLITDTSTGKRYVGSAYGDVGIWSRWCGYVETGHGNNVELMKLAGATGPDYARANFRFALLEHRAQRTDDTIVIGRESFWKTLLITRGEGGLNKN